MDRMDKIEKEFQFDRFLRNKKRAITNAIANAGLRVG
jgi:hypothetical protein